MLSQVLKLAPATLAEMTAMVEALSFLGPRGPVARDANRFKPARMFSLALACQRSTLCAQHRLRLIHATRLQPHWEAG